MMVVCTLHLKTKQHFISISTQVLGYQRTLQAGDLWKLDETREAGYLSVKLDNAWARRLKEAEAWNSKLDSGEIKPSFFKRARWAIQAVSRKDKKSYSEHRTTLETK